MKKEKHEEILREVVESVENALNDKRGLVAHQRRLAFSLSLGTVNIIELYFHKLNIIKEGAKIDHRWFKRKKERIKERLGRQIVSPIDSVKDIDEILDVAKKIEEKRDDLAYGVRTGENILQDKINLFLELRGVTKC